MYYIILYYITVVPNLFPSPIPPLSKLMTPDELTYFMDISSYIDCITKTVQNNQNCIINPNSEHTTSNLDEL